MEGFFFGGTTHAFDFCKFYENANTVFQEHSLPAPKKCHHSRQTHEREKTISYSCSCGWSIRTHLTLKAVDTIVHFTRLQLRMKLARHSHASFLLLLWSACCYCCCESFAPATLLSSRTSATALAAIGALVKKAKQAELREYAAEGVPESVMAQYQIIKEKAESIDLQNQTPGPLQEALTRRKGTLTVIAEYKRKLSDSGYIADIFDPEILSPVFREFGASAIAVMADQRMGGCTYQDLAAFCEEQRRAATKVPGPVAVINNDVIIDELQIARSAALNVAAVVLTLEIIGGADDLVTLLKAAAAVNVEAIVAVSTHEEAQLAVDLGARILSVTNADGIDEKLAVIDGLNIPEGQQVCKIANILAKNNKQLTEIEEAWAVRDKGFQCAWVGEALYKSGADYTEHPGAIIKAMKSKSSLKWASPKAKSGRGEGAREYLGDILM
jgi:indole-3-glycerol phosphate synthase